MKKFMWNAVASLVAFGAAWVARQGATAVWSRVSETDGPVNPADRSVTWTSALGWAALAGIAAGLARVVGRRGAATAWEGFVGETPPGVEAA